MLKVQLYWTINECNTYTEDESTILAKHKKEPHMIGLHKIQNVLELVKAHINTGYLNYLEHTSVIYQYIWGLTLTIQKTKCLQSNQLGSVTE